MRKVGASVALLLCAMMLASTSSLAQATRALAIDTAGQSLATALTDIARRSERELVIESAAQTTRAAPRLTGRYTLDQALPLLLAGSGLTYGRTVDGVYIVKPDWALAVAEPEVTIALPELLITARSQNNDIQRTRDDVQPYKVWTHHDIDRANAADLGDFLRVMATGDTETASARQLPSKTDGSNRSEVNLRGLGAGQTLVLIDGKRMPILPSGGGVSVLQSDLNGVPLAAIDRIEVLESTAGGIYGAGATAGAINIVLKRDYRGAELGGAYGAAGGGDARAARLDGRFGFTSPDGDTEGMIAFGFLQGDALSSGERGYAAKARARRLANDPASIASDYPVSGSINIFSASGQPLVLDATYGGATLSGPTTYASIGYGGAASDGAAQLLTNAGRLDLGLSPDVSGATQTLLSQRTVASLIGSLRHRLSASIEAYGDLLILRNDGQAVIPWNTTQVVKVLADAPTNPFQQDIYLTYPVADLDPEVRNRSRTTRGSVGLVATLAKGWKLGLDYSVGDSRVDVSLEARPIPPIVSAVVISGGRLDDGPPLDPVGGYPAFRAALGANALDAGYRFSQVAKFEDRSIRLAGPLADLGGGAMTVTVTAEHRQDRVPEAVYRRRSALTGGYDEAALPGLFQSARHYYAELRAPVTDRRHGPGGLKGLEIQLALSHERSRERLPATLSVLDPRYAATKAAAQSTTVYTLGFKVFPTDGLMVRASTASGFAPPRTDQLWSITGAYTSDLNTGSTTPRYLYLPAEYAPKDPRRGGEALGLSGGYEIVEGGSPTLQPERSRSLSAGLVFKPAWAERLRLSIDYTRIAKRREIVTSSAYDVDYFLRNEGLFPGRVTRASLTDADRAQGLTAGVVTVVDTTALNIGRTVVEAIDARADYLISTSRLGDLRLRATATWQPHLRRKMDPNGRAVEFAGRADGPLAWRGNGGVDWAWGKTTLGLTVTAYSGYRIHGGADSQGTIARKILQQGARRAPAQAYLDLFVARRVPFQGVSGLRDLQVRLGVQNALDHQPPLIAHSSPLERPLPYSPYGDPRGRRFEFGMVGHF